MRSNASSHVMRSHLLLAAVLAGALHGIAHAARVVHVVPDREAANAQAAVRDGMVLVALDLHQFAGGVHVDLDAASRGMASRRRPGASAGDGQAVLFEAPRFAEVGRALAFENLHALSSSRLVVLTARSRSRAACDAARERPPHERALAPWRLRDAGSCRHARRSRGARGLGGSRGARCRRDAGNAGDARHARSGGAGHEVGACLFGQLGPALGTRLVVHAALRAACRARAIDLDSGRSETHAHHSFRSLHGTSRERRAGHAPACAWEGSACVPVRQGPFLQGPQVPGRVCTLLRQEHNACRKHRFPASSWESYMNEEIAQQRRKPSYPRSEQAGSEASHDIVSPDRSLVMAPCARRPGRAYAGPGRSGCRVTRGGEGRDARSQGETCGFSRAEREPHAALPLLGAAVRLPLPPSTPSAQRLAHRHEEDDEADDVAGNQRRVPNPCSIRRR